MHEQFKCGSNHGNNSLPDRFTEFEVSLDTIAKATTGNIRITRDRFEQLRKLVKSPTELAILNTYRCEFNRLNNQLQSEVDTVIQELNRTSTNISITMI